MILNDEFIFNHFNNTIEGDLEYIYRGDMTPRLVMNILDFAKLNLEKAEDTTRIKSRIYFIMGEGLQNIARHQIKTSDISSEDATMVSINKKNASYYITTCNLINTENIANLIVKLEKINSLTNEELREFSRYTRMTTGISEKGGASIGLIEMAKRSGNKLSYNFAEIDNNLSYFYLSTQIPTNEAQKISPQESEEGNILHSLVNYHKTLNDKNIILQFKGDFNQENMLSLLDIIRSQMTESATSIKLFNIMVEMLQNIVKHADNISKEKHWKPGIFYIINTDTVYILSAGNYIRNDKLVAFKARLEQLNEMSTKDLNAEYNRIILNTDEKNAVTTGLGIIDMRRRSGNKLDFSFKQVSEIYTFFTIQIAITKK